ncbi:hypothetical protein SGLAM104S_03389 [Streptomyces glaucescens]
MNRMSCSMTRTAMPLSRIAEDQFLGGPGLLRVHAGGRLVEEEQARLARQRPGDLQLALLTVGQVAGEVVGLGGETGELQEFHGPFARLLLGLLEAGQPAAGPTRALPWCGCAVRPARSPERSCWRTAGCSGTYGRCRPGRPGAAWAAGRCPCRRTCWPRVGTYRPVRQLKKVVFPAPLGPMRPTISPVFTVRSTPRTAVRPLKRIVTPLASSTAVLVGAVVVVVMAVTPLPWRRRSLAPSGSDLSSGTSKRVRSRGIRAASCGRRPGPPGGERISSISATPKQQQLGLAR